MENNKKSLTHPSRSFGLDLIRAIAISTVLMAHFAKKIEVLGFWGVELFFVLSGFLIGQILWRNFNLSEHWGVKNLFNFWSRRWWRTLPNYYLFLMVMLVFSYYMNFPMPSPSGFTNFLWFGQNLLHANGGFYSVSWSLCIEEWFYLLFPIFLLLFSVVGFKRKQAFVLTFVVFFLLSILFRFYLANKGVDAIRTITLARLDSICCGVAMAYFSTVFIIPHQLKKIGFLLGLSLLLFSAFIIYHTKLSFQELSNSQLMLLIVPVSASFLLPYSSLLQRSSGTLGFFSTCIEKLSLWSYSIYLSHIPILFTVYALMGNLRNSIYGNTLSKLIGLALTLILSGFLFEYFELPFTRKRPKEIVT